MTALASLACAGPLPCSRRPARANGCRPWAAECLADADWWRCCWAAAAEGRTPSNWPPPADAMGGLPRAGPGRAGDLTRQAGIGGARARAEGAVELGRPGGRARPERGRRLAAAAEVWTHYRARLAHATVEEFWVLGLDVRHRLLFEACVARGLPDRRRGPPARGVPPAHPRRGRGHLVLSQPPLRAIPTPSRQDLELTRGLKEVGELCGIAVLDHVVVGAEGYYQSWPNAGWLLRQNQADVRLNGAHDCLSRRLPACSAHSSVSRSPLVAASALRPRRAPRSVHPLDRHGRALCGARRPGTAALRSIRPASRSRAATWWRVDTAFYAGPTAMWPDSPSPIHLGVQPGGGAVLTTTPRLAQRRRHAGRHEAGAPCRSRSARRSPSAAPSAILRIKRRWRRRSNKKPTGSPSIAG
jgi:DNA repair protein RadC